LNPGSSLKNRNNLLDNIKQAIDRGLIDKDTILSIDGGYTAQ